MDDLQLHMEIAQRNHDEASRLHNEFMQQSSAQAIRHQNITEPNEAEMDRLEREFHAWMEYIRNKKLD